MKVSDYLTWIAEVVLDHVVDVAFAAGHWIIHRPVLWHSAAVSHKTHHEHNHPSVLTNRTSIFALFNVLVVHGGRRTC